MSGFYNMLCGNNPMFWILARIVEQKGPLPRFPRFRDIYTREVDGRAQIVIFTRTGGNNRSSEEIEGCKTHPSFVETWDDSFDSTFAHFAFHVPDRLNDRVLRFHRLFSRHPKGMDPKTKLDHAMDALKGKSQVCEFTDDDMHAVVELCKDMLTDMRDGPSTLEIAIMSNVKFGVPQT